jgi:cytochrome oxidase Cu insertion factor (SCO1/SenC/PrrC family)
MRADSDMGPPGERGGWLQRKFVRYPWHFGVGLLLLVITGTRPFMRHIPEPPPVLFQVPDFALQDQDGRPFSLASMRGKVWVAGFIFTTCPSVCPKISRAMLDLQQRYARNGVEVELVSFTVDPENDTPAVLKRYAENLGADEDHWRFVTGERPAMEALVVEGFKTAMDRRDPPAPSTCTTSPTPRSWSSSTPRAVFAVLRRAPPQRRPRRSPPHGCLHHPGGPKPSASTPSPSTSSTTARPTSSAPSTASAPAAAAEPAGAMNFIFIELQAPAERAAQ